MANEKKTGKKSSGEEAESTQLTSSLFYKDADGKMDEPDSAKANASANLGMKKRDCHDHGNAVSREDFPNGYTLISFDTSEDLHPKAYFDPIDKGGSKLEHQFGSALTQAVNTLCMQNVII